MRFSQSLCSLGFVCLLLGAYHPAIGQAPAVKPVPKKIVLTRIDATKAVGMTVLASATGLTLETLEGSVAKTFPCDGTSIKIVSTKTTWSLKDKTGAGLLITDTNARYFTVVNRGIPSLAVTKIGVPITPISVPVHALTLINGVKAPIEVKTDLGHGSSETRTLKTVAAPLTMVCPYVEQGGKIVNSSFGIFLVHTDFGLGAKPTR